MLRRLPKSNPVPLFVFDGGYDAARLSRELEGYGAQLLVRLNSRRCFYGDPPEAPPGAPGRPRCHDGKFVCKDPATWPEPEPGRKASLRRLAECLFGPIRASQNSL